MQSEGLEVDVRSRWIRLIPVAWTTFGIVLLCVILVDIFPRLLAYIVPIGSLVLALAAYTVSNFYKDDLLGFKPSRKAVALHGCGIVLVAILSIVGIVFASVRNPARSGTVYGINLWQDALFDNLHVRDIGSVEKDISTASAFANYPCPDDIKSLCVTLVFSSKLTNDTANRINAVSFVETLGGREFPLTFMWQGNCYSDPFTLEPGESKVVGFVLPTLPVKYVEQYRRERRAPTISLIDNGNNRINMLNKIDLGNETVDKQNSDLGVLVGQCKAALTGLGAARKGLSLADHALVSVVQQGGIYVDKVEEIIDQGHAVCEILRPSDAVLVDAFDLLRRWRSSLSDEQVKYFIGATLVAYCNDLVGRWDPLLR